MKCKKIEVENKKIIEIYDDIFSAKELLHFHVYAQRSSYQLIRTSTGRREDAAICTLKCNLTHQQSLTDLKLISSHNFIYFLKIAAEKNLRLSRSYINLCTMEDLFPFHTDGFDEESLTMLYYMNTKWDPMWEGETHFGNESMTEIVATSSFIPGRIAIFNPTIPHKSSQPSSLAGQFRFTYAMFFVSKNQPCWNDSLDLNTLI